MISAICSLLLPASQSFVAVPRPDVLSAHSPRAVAAPRMLFGGGGASKEGGGGGGGMGNMMETIKKAQEVGVKVKALQEELVNTEIEATAADGGVTVVISGAQARPAPLVLSTATCPLLAFALPPSLPPEQRRSPPPSRPGAHGCQGERGLVQQGRGGRVGRHLAGDARGAQKLDGVLQAEAGRALRRDWAADAAGGRARHVSRVAEPGVGEAAWNRREVS